MKIVINPYSGYSEQLENALKKFGGSLEKPPCKDGLCPIPQPLKLLTKRKINQLIDQHRNVEENESKELIIVSLNEKDQLALVKMSRSEGWGTISGVHVKIVCEIQSN
jgi:hypothetical protein